MFAIIGGKGGCGRTTTTLGLTLAAAQAGHPAIAIDCDYDMPDLHLRAGTERTPTLAAATETTTPLRSVAQRVPDRPGAAILPAPLVTEDIGEGIPELSDSHAGPLFIDTPCGAGMDVTRIIKAVDRTILVTTPTPTAVRDVRKTARMARALDTPPVATIVVGATQPPTTVTEQVRTDRVYAIPQVSAEPLNQQTVRRAYQQVIEELSVCAPDRQPGHTQLRTAKGGKS